LNGRRLRTLALAARASGTASDGELTVTLRRGRTTLGTLALPLQSGG
jgi:hypothetical protein